MLNSYRICYHGTINVYAEGIMENIDIKKSRMFTDFGQGFYVTSDDKWSEFIYNCRINGMFNKMYHKSLNTSKSLNCIIHKEVLDIDRLTTRF